MQGRITISFGLYIAVYFSIFLLCVFSLAFFGVYIILYNNALAMATLVHVAAFVSIDTLRKQKTTPP